MKKESKQNLNVEDNKSYFFDKNNNLKITTETLYNYQVENIKEVKNNDLEISLNNEVSNLEDHPHSF